MSSPKKIAVIGAGIAGISAAYWLARRGSIVTVFESERYPAMKTSYANGSQLSVCNSGVWTTWPTVRKGLRWMLRNDAPLYISPSLDLAKIRWLFGFLSTTAAGDSDTATRTTISMALDSRMAVDAIAKEEKLIFDRVKRGIVHVYTDQDSYHAAIDAGDLMRGAGCDWQVLSHRQVWDHDRALDGNDRIIGGILTADDSTGDMHQFVTNLAAACVDRYGVDMRLSTPVVAMAVTPDGVWVNGEPYSDVVIAAGADAPRIASMVGDDLNIYPVKGYSITIDLETSSERLSAPWTSILDEDAKIVASRLGPDRLRVAGTAELDGHNLDIRQHRIKPLLDWTNRWFPGVSTRSYRPWTGLRPMTPNMLPIVGRSPRHRHVWYHAGHGHLGWTLCPGTGRKLAEQIHGY